MNDFSKIVNLICAGIVIIIITNMVLKMFSFDCIFDLHFILILLYTFIALWNPSKAINNNKKKTTFLSHGEIYNVCCIIPC